MIIVLNHSAARMNPNHNVNFMCTLGEEYNVSHRQRPVGLAQGPNRANNLRRMSRERSPFRPPPQGHNTVNYNFYTPVLPALIMINNNFFIYLM